MSFEFVARNGIISKGDVVVTGSVTATGGIITSGSLIHTGSLNISGSVVVTGSITSTDYIQPQYIASSASVVVMKPIGGSQYTTDFSTGGAGDLRFYYGGGGGWSFNWYTNNTKRVTIGDGGLTVTGSAIVKGTGTTSATTSLLVQNSAGSTAFQITDDRVINLIGGSTLKISSPLTSYANVVFSANGAAGGYQGGYSFKSGYNGNEGNTALHISSPSTTTSFVGIGNFTNADLGGGKLTIDNTLSGGRNAAIKLKVNFADIINEYNGIQFDTIENGGGGVFIGSQRNAPGGGYGADLAIFTTLNLSGINAYTETARFVGKSQALSLGAGNTPNAKLHISGSSGSALLEIDSPAASKLLPKSRLPSNPSMLISILG
jgi:hypothetical protein